MTRLLRLPSFANCSVILVALMALALPGCAGSQTGGEVLDEGADGCTIVSERVIEATAATSLGVKGSELLALLDGTFQATGTFAGSTGYATVSPDAGEMKVTVSFDVDATTLREIEREVKSSGDTTELTFAPGACAAQVAVDVKVRVAFDNGALDETLSSTIYFDSNSLARTTLRLDPIKLHGTLEIRPKAENLEIDSLTLSLALVRGSLSGKLDAVLASNDGEVATATANSLATFPSERCDAGYALALENELAQELTATLATYRDFNFTWPNQATTTLTLGYEVASACYLPPNSFGATEESVELAISTTAKTADGGIDGTWKLTANFVLDSEGKASSVAVRRDAYLADVFPTDTFAEDTGISGFVISGTPNASFDFTWNDQVGDALPTSGQMTFFGISASACDTTTKGDDTSGSTGGCAGMQATELGTATFSASE